MKIGQSLLTALFVKVNNVCQGYNSYVLGKHANVSVIVLSLENCDNNFFKWINICV